MTGPDPCRPYRQLARNALLANARLHRACAALSPGEWAAPRVAFFPSLKATLNHILIVDRFYLDAINGGTIGPDAWTDPEPYADLDGLVEEQRVLDAATVDLCEALTPDDLGRVVGINRGSRVQHETLCDILMHLFLHDQHHRGQVHAMLSGTTLRPPQLDEFFLVDDSPSRVADLTAIDRDESWLLR